MNRNVFRTLVNLSVCRDLEGIISDFYGLQIHKQFTIECRDTRYIHDVRDSYLVLRNFSLHSSIMKVNRRGVFVASSTSKDLRDLTNYIHGLFYIPEHNEFVAISRRLAQTHFNMHIVPIDPTNGNVCMDRVITTPLPRGILLPECVCPSHFVLGNSTDGGRTHVLVGIGSFFTGIPQQHNKYVAEVLYYNDAHLVSHFVRTPKPPAQWKDWMDCLVSVDNPYYASVAYSPTWIVVSGIINRKIQLYVWARDTGVQFSHQIWENVNLSAFKYSIQTQMDQTRGALWVMGQMSGDPAHRQVFRVTWNADGEFVVTTYSGSIMGVTPQGLIMKEERQSRPKESKESKGSKKSKGPNGNRTCSLLC